VQREALTKVHQCVFAILALESEEVDGTLWVQRGLSQKDSFDKTITKHLDGIK
jgi:hypothetical protein